MRTFDTLYALDKKGKIRTFDIKVEHGNTCSFITASTGLLYGNKVQHVKEVSSGRQGRSYASQAEFEAQSKWDSKLDEGYKSFEMLKEKLGTRITTGHLAEETPNTISAIIDELRLRWNTSRNWTPLPMLADKFKEGKVKYPKLIQRKYNGVRNISISMPTRLCSRGGKYYTGLSHIEREVELIHRLYPNAELDGELYTHGVGLDKISGTCRREQRDIFEDNTWLEYHVYDLAMPDMSQNDRDILRREIFANIKDLQYIKFVESYIVKTDEEVWRFHDMFVQEGYEGAILRDMSAPYMFSFRDKCLLKVKNFIEEEFEVVGCEYDAGIGISSFCFDLVTEDGQEFGMRPIGSHDLWQEYLENIENIKGKKVTCKFLEYSENGIPQRGNVTVIRDYE